MGCYQVRYNSRVVIYEHKLFIRLTTGLLLWHVPSSRLGGGHIRKTDKDERQKDKNIIFPLFVSWLIPKVAFFPPRAKREEEACQNWLQPVSCYYVKVGSVTRFGLISPLWQQKSSLFQFLDGPIILWQSFQLTLANFNAIGQIFIIVCKWEISYKWSGHLVTLIISGKI